MKTAFSTVENRHQTIVGKKMCNNARTLIKIFFNCAVWSMMSAYEDSEDNSTISLYAVIQ